jgi:hypothetical protein
MELLKPGAQRERRPERAVGHLRWRATMEWFSRKTSIAGTEIPNWALVLVAVIVIWIIYRLLT